MDSSHPAGPESHALHIGDAVLYMKVGTHAQEELADILTRKRQEIITEGFAMWGYGGNTCHPGAVQWLAKAADQPIILCMQPMQSRHFAEPRRAEEYSVDGTHWKLIPRGINVLGSKYALCIDRMEEVNETLDLSDTRVALGPSKGVSGDLYVRGRVDKACLEIVGTGAVHLKPATIKLMADIVDPFAVFVRS
jgi:hypothetical protein